MTSRLQCIPYTTAVSTISTGYSFELSKLVNLGNSMIMKAPRVPSDLMKLIAAGHKTPSINI